MTALEIDRIAAGGDGVGRLPDGMTVFVPRTAPGDVVELERLERKKRYARAHLRAVVSAGPDRVEPPCAHYDGDRCGGCQLQHLAIAAQCRAKARIVGDALRRIGKRAVDDPEVVPAGASWRYRTRVTLAARAGRVGYHRFDAPAEVFDVEDCRIARHELMTAWRSIREERAVLPRAMTALTLRLDRGAGLHLVVEVAPGEEWEPERLARAAGEDTTVWWRPPKGAARVVWGRREAFPATAFEQVHPELATRIRAEAVAGLGSVDGAVVWDLYGGVGETAALLAAKGAQVWTVDRDRSAVEWGGAHGVPTGGAVTRLGEPVETAIGRLPAPRAVVVNPPRVGMATPVTTAIEGWGRAGPGRRMAYVSCDAATLARDLGRMPSMAVADLAAYDLFPQTSHVETLAVLEAA